MGFGGSEWEGVLSSGLWFKEKLQIMLVLSIHRMGVWLEGGEGPSLPSDGYRFGEGGGDGVFLNR